MAGRRIGRVEFLVDLDGNNLPRQARDIGRKAGAEGAKGFGDEFDSELSSTFDRRISKIGDQFAKSLSGKGQLAGRRFADDFSDSVTSRFRTMQRDVADILSDKDSFDRYARGFDSVTDAVTQLESDLNRLRKETVSLTDENGDLYESAVLTEEEHRRFARTAQDLGDRLQTTIDRENETADAHRRLAAETEELEGKHRRLLSLVGDTDAFRKYSRQVGGTGEAHRRLSAELEGVNKAFGRNRDELDLQLDALDRTRDKVDQLNASVSRNTNVLDSNGRSLSRVGAELDDTDEKVRKLSLGWGDMSHNARQWTLIIGAIAAGMQHLSGLTSALGAGLLAVGGGLSSAVVGGGGLVAVFTSLSKEVDDLPEGMRDVATQFRNLGQEGLRARDLISEAAFAEMPQTFNRLSGSLRALSPEFSALGTVSGRMLDDLSIGLSEGSEGFDELRELIRNGTRNFGPLTEAVGTWGTALMRGLNEANPMVEQLIGYVDLLGNRFDDFTKSDSFGEWVQNSMDTFTEFGELLDATGRMLNDLVTPESIDRLHEFLDNLTDFMPHLGNLLDVLGRLDVFGLIAELLAEFGDALEPLYEPAGLLADALNDLGVDVIPILADGLEALATLLAPVVTGAAALVDAIPPEFIGVLAGVAAGFALLKGASGLAGLATQFGLSAAAADRFRGAVSTGGATLKGVLGKAGMVGIAISGLFALGDALKDAVTPSLKEVTVRLEQAADGFDIMALAGEKAGASTGSMLEDMRTSFIDFGQDLGLVGENVTGLAVDLEAMNGPLGGFLGFMDDIGISLTPSIQKIQELDQSFASLASENMPLATERFIQLIEQQKLSKDQAEQLISRMGGFRDALIDQAKEMDVAITNENLLAIATGEMTAATDISTGSTERNTDALVDMTDKAGLTEDQVDNLADSIRNFSSDTLSSRDANRQFEAAIDDLTASLATNGNTLDTNTAQGRANEAAIDDLAEATLERAAALLQETGDQEAATAAIQKGRDALVQQMIQMGYSEQAANDYVDDLGLIPENIYTHSNLLNTEQAAAYDRALGAIRDTVNVVATLTNQWNVEDQLNWISRDRSSYINVTAGGSGFDYGNRSVTWNAAGGIKSGAQIVGVGEAGPEAIVPLNRPLGQVDPSVRWLSAIAQGMAPPQMASGGVAGGGRSIIFEPGSIVVNEAQDSRRTAYDVADAIARRIGS